MNIKFYYAAGANCCERVRWALDFKCIAYELIDLEHEFDEAHFADISPFGRCPIMEIDGRALSESMAMVEFIEEIYPSPPLSYSDPFLRAQVREICEAVNSSIHPAQNSSIIQHFRPDLNKEQMKPIRAHWIASNLAKLEAQLWQNSSFAIGSQFTLADIFIAVIYRKGIKLGNSPKESPCFETHWQHLLSQPGIKESCPIIE